MILVNIDIKVWVCTKSNVQMQCPIQHHFHDVHSETCNTLYVLLERKEHASKISDPNHAPISVELVWTQGRV